MCLCSNYAKKENHKLIVYDTDVWTLLNFLLNVLFLVNVCALSFYSDLISTKQRGVFKPVRTYYSKAIAAIATFLVSGLLHEYLLFILACARKEYGETVFWTPNYGNHMSFFAWNGTVLIFESLYGSTWIFRWMKHRLPQPIITSLILLTALPIAHWFTHELIILGVYKDFILFVPLIVQL